MNSNMDSKQWYNVYDDEVSYDDSDVSLSDTSEKVVCTQKTEEDNKDCKSGENHSVSVSVSVDNVVADDLVIENTSLFDDSEYECCSDISTSDSDSDSEFICSDISSNTGSSNSSSNVSEKEKEKEKETEMSFNLNLYIKSFELEMRINCDPDVLYVVVFGYIVYSLCNYK